MKFIFSTPPITSRRGHYIWDQGGETYWGTPSRKLVLVQEISGRLFRILGKCFGVQEISGNILELVWEIFWEFFLVQKIPPQSLPSLAYAHKITRSN